MEDFLKNKLSEYKPAFKEAYWTEMSAKLQKKKRRKRLVFFILSSASALILISLIWSIIYFNRYPASPIHPKEIAVKQHTETKLLANKMDKPLPVDEGNPRVHLKESSSNTNQTEASTNKTSSNSISTATTTETAIAIAKNTETETTSAISSSSPQITETETTGEVSNSSPQITGTETTRATATVNTNEKTSANPLASGGQDGKSISNQKQSMAEKSLFVPASQQESNIASDNEHQNHDIFHQSNTPFDAKTIQLLNDLTIPLFNRKLSLPMLAPLQHVKINARTINYPSMATAIQIGTGIVSTSSNDLIYEQSISLKRYVQFDRSTLYAAFGMGAGRYTGTFHAIEHEQVSFRTFVENSVSQSLVPDDLYCFSIPIEFGVSLGKLNAGINISPEYLFAVHGNVVTSELSRTVATTNNIQEPLEFTVHQESNTQKKSTWIDSKNVKKINYSLGLIAGYRVGRHWQISISGNYYPDGLYSFKRSVQSSTSITGRKNNLKGGLHVAYIF